MFQLQIIGWTLAGLKSLEPSFRRLGIAPQEILHLGRAKQTLAFQTLWDALGVSRVPPSRVYVTRAVAAVAEVLFSEGRGWVAAFRDGWRRDLEADMPATSLHPDEAPQKVKLPR